MTKSIYESEDFVLKKQALSMVFVLMAAVGLLAFGGVTAFAADDQGTCGESLTWKYTDSTGVLTISGTGDMTSHPWDDYKSKIERIQFTGEVTSIDEDAFSDCINLDSVTIPASVSVIGNDAFYNCKNLENVMFSKNSNLVTLGDDAGWYDYGVFRNCVNLYEITLPDKLTRIADRSFMGCTNLETVTIGKSVKSIDSGAFKDCVNLTAIVIPDSVESIGSEVFYNCAKLASVNLGNGLQTIGESAFEKCSSLTSIVIPASVTKIENKAFKNLEKLSNVTFASNSNLITLGTEDYWSDYGVFQNCTGIKTITLPDKLTTIELNTFAGCTGLQTVTIGKGVKEIHSHAFRECSSLTSVVVPDNVETIDYGAFRDCTSLTTVTLGSGVQKIGMAVFDNCTKLKTVDLGSGLQTIGEAAFEQCNSLTSIVIPASVTKIENRAFQNLKNLTSVKFAANSNLAELGTEDYWGGQGVFENCTGLKGIILPDKLTNILLNTFKGCSSLQSVTVGKHVVSISSDAFRDCTALTTVVLPKALTSISNNAFSNCSALDTVKYTGTQARWNNLKSDGIGTEGNAYLLNAPHYVYEYVGEVDSVSVKTKPTKLTYYMGDTLDTAGLVLSVSYDIGTTQDITTGFTCSPTKLNTAGTQKITVTYKGKTASFDVTVKKKASSVAVKTKPSKLTYNVGDAFDSKGMVLTVTYTDGTSGDITSGFTCSPAKLNTAGTQKITVTYQGVAAPTFDVTVKNAVTITKAPVNVSAYVGSKATFSLEATGNGLTYQWYYKKAGETTWTKWNNKTSASVTTEVYASWNKAQFYCAVTNVGGAKVNSKAVTLTVLPKITAQPANGKAPVNDKVTFTVKATGYNLTYQWYYKKNGEDSWTKWNNKTSASITAEVYASWNKAQVYCRIKDGNGTAISSNTVQMLVAPKITSQPANVSKAVNEKATFTVKATGDGLTYQWYYKKPSDTSWVKWSNQTKASATMTVYGSWHNTKVYCAVKNNLGNTVNSQTAVLSVVPKITFQPANCVGYVGDKVSFDVEASGTGLTYQWYYKKAGESSWSKWNKKTAATAETEVYASWNGASFYCQVKSSNGASVNSKTATLTVKPKITVQPTNVSGKSGSKISVTVKATGDGLKYQWQYSNDKGKTWSKSSITSSSYTVTLSSGMNGRYVRCIVSDRNNYQVTSKSAVIKVA